MQSSNATNGGSSTSPLRIVLLYAVFAGAWIFFSDQILAFFFNDPAQITFISTLKGSVFIAVTALLLYATLNRRCAPQPLLPTPKLKLQSRWFCALFLLLSLLIMVMGNMVFHSVSHTLKEQLNDELVAVTEFKARQIEAWIDEHRFLATDNAQAPFFIDAVRAWQQKPDQATTQRLSQRLNMLRKTHGFTARGVTLLSLTGETLLEAGENELGGHDLAALVELAAGQSQALFIDLHPLASAGAVHMEFIAAVREPDDVADAVPLGFLRFSVNPTDDFYPMLRSWPRPGNSAEAFIVRREGDDAVFLSPLRLKPAAQPLSFRQPLFQRKNLPAAQAILQGSGLYEGVDYRNVPVLSAARHVHGTSWMFLAKIDQAEVYGNIRRLAATSIALVMTAIGIAGLLLYLIWRQQRLRDASAARDQLEKIAASAPGVIYSFHRRPDGSSCLPYASPAIEELFGLSAAALAEDATPIFASIHPEDVARVQAAIAASARDLTPWQAEWRMRHPYKGEIWLEGHSMPLRQADGATLWHGFVQDITQRKRDQQTLVDSEQRLRMSQAYGGIGTWESDLVDNRQYWSETVTQLLGFRALEHPSWEDFLDHIHPDDRQQVITATQAHIEHNARYDVEYRIFTADGLWRWMRSAGQVERDGNGKPVRMRGIVQNITERKETEIALSERRQLLSVIIDSALDAVVQMNAAGLISGWNNRAETIFGWTQQEAVGLTMHATIIPHRYREAHVQAIKHYLATGEGRILNTRIELYALHRDGHEFPVELSVAPIVRGGEISFSAFIRDITERKRAEESMQLAALVYQNTSEAIVVTDAEGSIIDINPAFTQTTGYVQHEVLGKNPRILSSGHHDRAFYQAMWQSITATGYWQGEIWNRRKNGEIYVEWLTINTIFNADDSVHRRVGLFTDITQNKQSEEIIWQQANFDALTGLPNRRMFHDCLEREIKKARQAGLSLALLFFDLDRFKEINEVLGHGLGDGLLKKVAQRLTGSVREIDTVARLGGDEFAVILGELEHMGNLDHIAEAILQQLTEPFSLENQAVYVSASMGITLYPQDAIAMDALLRNAEQAMYVAKAQGRNRHSYFAPFMQEAAQIRMQIANDLRSALNDDQFKVYYQPIVELASGIIGKAEALIRWQHPARGFISPAAFIPIAEETGMINEIGDWVFRTAANQAASWRSTYADGFQVSVNKSPVQFRSRADVGWVDYLQEIGLAGQSIVVEITEGVLLDSGSAIRDKLFKLRGDGLQVAIDDFGTGYSALSYLQKFDIDYLKIDQSFVRNLAPDSSDLALCEAIIVMAHKLGIKVIAEGIETAQQRDLLTAAGCDYGQGYLFAKPMPALEFDAMLQGQCG
ncbi:MAG: EAL domain-containing protein [Methylococcaceae bacterium]|nr:MAG: EAL domain-containing protein [Methylococcaceae bacterium]